MTSSEYIPKPRDPEHRRASLRLSKSRMSLSNAAMRAFLERSPSETLSDEDIRARTLRLQASKADMQQANADMRAHLASLESTSNGATLETKRQVSRAEELHKKLEPGTFSINAEVIDGEARVKATANDGSWEDDITDRFLPDADGKMSVIIRRRPELLGGDWPHYVSIRPVFTGSKPYVIARVTHTDGTKPKQNILVEELAQAHPDDKTRYWDLRPEI